MFRKLRLPSPAMAVALAALFVALSGTAVAAGVPALAKRALVADNAKKLGGQTPAALLAAAKQSAEAAASAAAQQPGPASTAAGLIAVKSASWSSQPQVGFNNFTAMCDAGEKVMSGGWSDPGDWSDELPEHVERRVGRGWTTTATSASTGRSGSADRDLLRRSAVK